MKKDHRERRGSSIAVNSIFNVVHTAVKLLFPLLTSMYAARVLSVEGIGKFTTANNLVSYFVVFSALGIPVYGVREIAKLRGKSGEKDRLFTELLILNAVSTLICTVLYFALILNRNAFREDVLVYLACGSLILFNFINIDWLYKGSEEYRYIALRSAAVKILLLAAIVLFVRDREDYILYALITCLGHGANYVLNVIQARKLVKLTFRGLNVRRHIGPVCYLFAGTFFATLYSKVDITMLGFFSGERSAAYYAYAHRIVEMATMVCVSISEVFLPRLSYYYHHDRVRFREILDIGVRVLVFLSFPMAVGLGLLAPQAILLLYGSNFLPASSAMRLMAPLVIIKSIGDLVCYQLVICTGNEKKRIPVYAAAAAVNVALNAVLIPRLAEQGAVIASVASELIVNLGVFWSIRKSVAIALDKKSLFQSALTSLVMGVGVYAVCMLPLPLLPKTLAAVAAGVVLYGLANLAVRNNVVFLFLNKLRSVINRR